MKNSKDKPSLEMDSPGLRDLVDKMRYRVDYYPVGPAPDSIMPIRLQIAAMAMQGVLREGYPDAGEAAEYALRCADELIRRFNESEK